MWRAVGLLVGILALGCGLWGEPAEAPVVPTVMPPGVTSPAWRYVEETARLEFPTPTVRPTITRRPPRTLARTLPRTLSPSRRVSAQASTPAVRRELESLSCLDHYRHLLIDYVGRAPFGAETAWQLSEEFLKSREDCSEQGWEPEFGLEASCVSVTVGGVRISDHFIEYEGSLNTPRVLSTGMDRAGNILVHFQKLPFQEQSGCWYFSARGKSWAWVALGVGTGVDLPKFPVCEERLKELVVELDGPGFSSLDAARAIDIVRLEMPAQCGTALWGLYPRREGHDECAGDTGQLADGSILVNWHPEHRSSGGAICWKLSSDGEWLEIMPGDGG